MKRMVAYCGLVCTDCDGYIATQKGDRAALEELARKAKADYGVDTTADGCMCDGCTPVQGRKIDYCSTCEIRACAVARRVENCAHCADYACGNLTAFFGMAKNAKPVLDAIHATL
jgi:predicted nucleic acid binding AN1-type Zn finger protein